MENVAKYKSIVRSNDVLNVKVLNELNEDLGKIYEIVLNKLSGQVIYAVLESGAFLGIGGKFFAVPWSSLKYDVHKEAFILHINKKNLEQAPGFDKNNWPIFSNHWSREIDIYYSKVMVL
jgi:sporulation protein YlmC with PRC-barrel domain